MSIYTAKDGKRTPKSMPKWMDKRAREIENAAVKTLFKKGNAFHYAVEFVREREGVYGRKSKAQIKAEVRYAWKDALRNPSVVSSVQDTFRSHAIQAASSALSYLQDFYGVAPDFTDQVLSANVSKEAQKATERTFYYAEKQMDKWYKENAHLFANYSMDKQADILAGAISKFLEEGTHKFLGDATISSMGHAQNYYGQTLHKSGSYTTKNWETVGDNKVRGSHWQMQALGDIPYDATFPNGLRYPHDDGPASETRNCRCSLGLSSGGTPPAMNGTEGPEPGPGVNAEHLKTAQDLADQLGVPVVLSGSRQTGMAFADKPGKPRKFIERTQEQQDATDLDLGLVASLEDFNSLFMAADYSKIPNTEHPPMMRFDSIDQALQEGNYVVVPRALAVSKKPQRLGETLTSITPS